MSAPAPPKAPPCEVLSFTSDHFYQSLANEYLTEIEVGAKPTSAYLYRYLTDIHAATIVVEREYTDGDFLDDFSVYYSRCFHNYARRCSRLHFFDAAIARDQILAAACGADPAQLERIQKSYLGFIVARPLPQAIIGRTVLKTYPEDGGRRNYTATRKYSANLYGIELTVTSLAFQEQDTVLAACATVSLWSAFHKTKELFGPHSPTPADITRAANSVIYNSRPIPSHGLIVEQICSAIRHLGLEPEVVPVMKNTPLASLLHGHLKAGIPVILGIRIEGVGLHAITLNGYSKQADRVRQIEVAQGTSCIPMTGLRIDEFYAHDDQIGPFARMAVRPPPAGSGDEYPIVFEGSWQDESTGQFLTLYPLMAILPVYHKIRVTFGDIQVWLTNLHLALLSLPKAKDTDWEWDLFLTTTNDLKAAVKIDPAFDAVAREQIMLAQHPRFVWRATLRYMGRNVLDIFGDATGIARSLPIYAIHWHDDGVRSRLHWLLTLTAPGAQDDLRDLLTPNFLAMLLESTAAS